jgi:hypothetical protein
MVYSGSKLSSIWYECAAAGSDRMTCKFTELDVWKHRDPSLEASLAQATQKPADHFCAEARRLIDERAKQPPSNRDDALEAAQALHTACTTGTREAIHNWLTVLHRQSERTCRFVAHTYQQAFRRAPSDPGHPLWITDGTPYLPCAIKRQSRFSGTPIPDSQGTYWSYTAQIEIQNKSAKDGPLSCSDLRDREAVYSWQQDKKLTWADCHTVEFSSPCSLTDFPCLSDGPVVMH